jgi:hypothetical protein
LLKFLAEHDVCSSRHRLQRLAPFDVIGHAAADERHPLDDKATGESASKLVSDKLAGVVPFAFRRDRHLNRLAGSFEPIIVHWRLSFFVVDRTN